MVFDLLARGLRGRAPSGRVPDGTRVYAVGDIHGCLEQLEALHRMILEDAAEAEEGRLVVVYVGDYVDRGLDCKGVVECLVGDPLPGFEAVHLRGNHEDFLLHFLDDPRTIGAWMMNGGGATLASYGVSQAEASGSSDAREALRGELKFRMPPGHLAFFEGLELSHIEGDYLFVHAGIRPGVALEDQVPEDLMWIREPFLNSSKDLGKIVVHGHTPLREPELRANRIGIDTGAVYGGMLTALVLERDQQRFLQA